MNSCEKLKSSIAVSNAGIWLWSAERDVDVVRPRLERLDEALVEEARVALEHQPGVEAA